MIYTPSQVAPPGMEERWEQTKRHDGFIIAGKPYSIDEESLETGFYGVGTEFPVGENTKIWKTSQKTLSKHDSDGTGTTGTIYSESTSGAAGETSGELFIASLRRSESGTLSAENAATAHHWRTRQHGRQARDPKLRAHIQHQCMLRRGKKGEVLSLPTSEGGMGLKKDEAG